MKQTQVCPKCSSRQIWIVEDAAIVRNLAAKFEPEIVCEAADCVLRALVILFAVLTAHDLATVRCWRVRWVWR